MMISDEKIENVFIRLIQYANKQLSGYIEVGHENFLKDRLSI